MYVGNTLSIGATPGNAAVVMDFSPRVRRDSTDLTAFITVSEAMTNQTAPMAGQASINAVSIQTNFAAAARVQIPHGSGVFPLNDGRAVANGKRVGVLISVTLPQPKP